MDKASVMRLLVLIASLFTYLGINVPESTLELVSFVVLGVTGLYTAYKNNYLFKRGKKQKEILEMTNYYKAHK